MMQVGETQEAIERRIAALGQYAVVLSEFHRALKNLSVPDGLAGELVVAWWENVLRMPEWEDDE